VDATGKASHDAAFLVLAHPTLEEVCLAPARSHTCVRARCVTMRRNWGIDWPRCEGSSVRGHSWRLADTRRAQLHQRTADKAEMDMSCERLASWYISARICRYNLYESDIIHIICG
jgi:hypothetical protein